MDIWTPEIKDALRGMGYRPMGRGVWGKPVAYHLLAVREGKEGLVLVNCFTGADPQKILTWDCHPLDITRLEESLRSSEYATRLNVGQPSQTTLSFAFLMPEERYADLL